MGRELGQCVTLTSHLQAVYDDEEVSVSECNRLTGGLLQQLRQRHRVTHINRSARGFKREFVDEADERPTITDVHSVFSKAIARHHGVYIQAKRCKHLEKQGDGGCCDRLGLSCTWYGKME